MEKCSCTPLIHKGRRVQFQLINFHVSEPYRDVQSLWAAADRWRGEVKCASSVLSACLNSSDHKHLVGCEVIIFWAVEMIIKRTRAELWRQRVREVGKPLKIWVIQLPAYKVYSVVARDVSTYHAQLCIPSYFPIQAAPSGLHCKFRSLT